jgi:hypothetical protein
MKNHLLITMLISMGLLGCATRPIYSVTIFAIQGRVIDQESNFPLEKVNVYFIDTGYDDHRSGQPTPIKVAQSDERGNIEARLNYPWKRKTSGFSPPPRATFDIVLSRERYQTKRLHFKQSVLQSDAVTFLVDLKDVYMVRELN